MRTKLPLPSALRGLRVENRNLCAGRIQEIAEVAGLEIGSRNRLQSAGAAQARIVQSLAEEQESLIAAVIDLGDVDRAADLEAAFVLPQFLFHRTLEETAGVQLVVAEIVVDLAVDGIRAGFHGDGGEPTPETAELGIEGVRHHGVLGHRFHHRAILQHGAAAGTEFAGGRAINEDLGGALHRGVDAARPRFRRFAAAQTPIRRSVSRQEPEVVRDVALLAEDDHRQVVDELGGEIAWIRGGRHVQ